ncbi:hypothetical protein DQ04_07491050 [Trypanosoma grayi]|uniref:hypothetical protein n=1 Tax=Trypanosoma grayi TaxID=71804 RepID=UPI0004F450D3|nr:hypothetical protein DQ04_07491050 [Trypanosoma grayi]KEG08304.1 hypothetical protein DQ04_07491050 [Trypanosoma grayi]
MHFRKGKGSRSTFSANYVSNAVKFTLVAVLKPKLHALFGCSRNAKGSHRQKARVTLRPQRLEGCPRSDTNVAVLVSAARVAGQAGTIPTLKGRTKRRVSSCSVSTNRQPLKCTQYPSQPFAFTPRTPPSCWAHR